MSINNPSAGKARPGTTLTVWTPEDKAFWEAEEAKALLFIKEIKEIVNEMTD